MKLYVKNLPWGTTSYDVYERFGRYGTVSTVDVHKDDANFEVSATVDMPYAGEARRAMNNLDGAIYKYEEKGEILRVEVSLVERDDWESKYVLLKEKYDELKRKYDELEEERDDLKNERDDLEEERDDLKSKRDDLKKKYRDLESERDDFERKYRERGERAHQLLKDAVREDDENRRHDYYDPDSGLYAHF